jgi:putative nucleotidyltransferase with HDIG domain
MPIVSACPFCAEPAPAIAKSLATAQLYACLKCCNPYLIGWREGQAAAYPLEHARDIRQTAPPGSIGAAILERIPEAMDRLPVLPELSQQILAMVRDPDVSMNDLAQVIRKDQVIAMSIMRLANSAMYGGLHEVKDLSGASARLGMRAIANLVQVVVNGGLFEEKNKDLKTFSQRLWRHSIAVANCSSEIAGLIAEPGGETLFLAGLIHDIGKVVAVVIVSNEREGLLAELRGEPKLLNEVFDSFHALLGLHAVQRWNLPAEFRTILYAHHQPELCPVEEWLPMAHTVCLADLVAKVEGYGTDPEPVEAFLVNHPSARYLNLSDIKLAALRVDLADKLDAFMEASGAA